MGSSNKSDDNFFQAPQSNKSHDDTYNPFARNVNYPTDTFIVVIILCLALFIIAIMFFSLLRNKLKRIYSPRLLLMPDKLLPHGKLPSSLFSWISPAFMISDDDIFNHLGLDALAYLRFLRLLLKAAIFTLPYGIFILIPLNVHGGMKKTEGLDMISMSNVDRQSGKLWAHFLAVWIYSLTLLYMINEEWKIYVLYRQTYMTKKLGKEHVLLVQDIPKENQDDENFKEYLKELFPDQIHATYVIKNLREWQVLVDKHDKLVKKLERAKAADGDPAELHSGSTHMIQPLKGKAVKIERELESLHEAMGEEQYSHHKATSAGIVVFKTLASKTAASQMVWDFKAGKYKVSSAPDASEVIWSNIALSAWKRSTRRTIACLIVAMLVVLWAIPITFIAGLTKLQSLAKQFTFLKPIADDKSSLLRGLLQGIVPVSLVALFNMVLPYVLQIVGRISGLVSKARIQLYVFSNLTLFLLCNTFFFFMLAGSFFSSMKGIVDAPKNVTIALAQSLPAQANYYINYVCLMAFVGNGIEITRIFWLIYISCCLKCWAKTPRERLEAWKPGDPPYAYLFANDVLIFLIGLTFSVLSPVIIPVVIIYFAYRYIVWVYQLLHVYIQEVDLGGMLWPRVSSSMIVGTVIFQALMIGVFTLKKAFMIVGLIAPLPFITFGIWKFINSRYGRVAQFLSLREGRSMRNADSQFLQNIANSYVRNYKCPGVYEVSKQIQLEDMDGGGYASLDEEAGKELQSSAKELQASDYQSIK